MSQEFVAETGFSTIIKLATSALTDDRLLPFSLPTIKPKKVIAAFDGGRLSSDGGVALLALAEKRVGIIERLTGLFPDERDPERVTHPLGIIIGARVFAIGCGYEDGNDLDHPRKDPAFKLACGRLPDSGHDWGSQSTISRLENAPSLRDVVRLTSALIDQWIAGYRQEPDAVTLDIDDSVDVVHGCQQLSLFNAYYDERCFLPIPWLAIKAGQPERNVYDSEPARPVAVILRPGKTPSGVEIRGHLRRLVRRIRRHWPTTRVTFRGDSHYACPEVMSWFEANGISYIFGLAGIKPLGKKVDDAADATAAYWLISAVRDAIPKIQDLAKAEFKTIRSRLVKIAARIIETKSRIRVAFATACPDADLFRGLAIALQRGGP